MANKLKKQEELHQIYLAGYKEHPLTLKPNDADLLKRAKNQPGCRGKIVLIHGFTQKIPDFQLILQAAQKENLSVNLTTTGKTTGSFKEYVFEIDDEKLVSGYFANEKVARDVLSPKARQLLEENCFSIIVKCNKRGRNIRRSDIINPYLIENYSRGTRAFNNPSPDALADLKNNVTKILMNYINSPESDALIFDTSFSEKERKSFGPLAEKLNLRFNHYGKQAGRLLVISKAYLSWDLVEHILANGDETLTFKLIRPQSTVDSLPECKILPMPSRAETKAENNRRSTENSPPAKKARMDEDNQNKDVHEKSTAESNTKESDTTKPKTTESNITASTTTESKTTQSKTIQSNTKESDTTKPKTTESNITASTTTQSKTTESNTTQPQTTPSKTTESKTTQPQTTPSKTTESKTTQPQTTPLKTTESKTTQPQTTPSKTTESKTKESKTAEPNKTNPTEPNRTEPKTTKPNTTEPNTTESNTKKGADSDEKYDLDTFMEELEKCSKQEDKFAPDTDINKDTDSGTHKGKEGGEESIQNEVKSEVSQDNSAQNTEDSEQEDDNMTEKDGDTNTEGDEQDKGTDAHENDKTSEEVIEIKEGDEANESKEAATDKPSFWESDLCFSNFEDNSMLPQDKDDEKADKNKEQAPESDSKQDTRTRAEKLLARRLKNREKLKARKLKKRLENQNLKETDVPRGIPIGKKAGPKGGKIQKGGRAMNKGIEDRLYSKVKPGRRSPDRRSNINQIPSLFEVDLTGPPAGSSHGYGGYDDPMDISWGPNNKAARRKHARELKKQKYRDNLEERRGYKAPLPGLSTFAQEFLHRVRSQVGCRGRIVLYHEYSKTTPSPSVVLQTSVNKIGMHMTTKPTGEIRGTNFGYALYIGKEEMLRDYFEDEKKAHDTLVPRVYELLKETCFSVMVKTDKDGQLIRRKDLAISKAKGRQRGNWNTRDEELTLNVNQVFEDYIRSPHSYNLIFDTDFSYNEKSYFSRISQTYKLRHRFHGNKTASVLLVWKPLNLWDLAEHLLANGGETPSYRLVLPTRYV